MRRADDGRLVDGGLLLAMLHHLQVLCGSVDMLALVMCFAGRKMYNSAATKVHKLGYLGSEGMALQRQHLPVGL